MNSSEYEFSDEFSVSGSRIKACYYRNQTSNVAPLSIALTSALPTFILQVMVVLLTSRILLSILRPLKQPSIVAYLLTGFVLSGLAPIPFFANNVFPLKSVQVMETFANLALVYYMFLVGLEVNVDSIMHCGRKAFAVAILGILIPLGIGLGLFFLLGHFTGIQNDTRGSMFWAVAFTASNFPEVAGILADLKLLHSDIGRLALSSSIISDFCTWILLVVTLSIVNSRTFFTILNTLSFVLLCFILVRPIISMIISNTISGDDIKDNHIYFILGWVVFFGLVFDACGVHSFVGGFIFGVIMPPDEMEIKAKITEKLEDFVSGIMLPLFFLMIGHKTNIIQMVRAAPWHALLLIVAISLAAKILSTILVCLFTDLKLKEGLALGLLMNTKGVMPFIAITTGVNIQALNTIEFPVIAVSLILMTAVVEPIIAATYKSRRKLMRYKRRTIESVFKPGTPFKVLACVHSTSDVLGMINLLEASNATKDFPIRLIGVHLVELTRRATAMLVVNDQCNRDIYTSFGCSNSESDQIADAFKSYSYRTEGVTNVQTITIVSNYRSMHEDICNLAQDSRATLIILPYYRSLLAGDARSEDVISTFHDMCRDVSANAPCSLGLLIDRGANYQDQRVVMLFVGGADDREALAYAWRMASSPSLKLTVVRFLPGITPQDDPESVPTITMSLDEENEKRLDEDCTYEFMWKTAESESINYVEKVVNNGEETLAAMREHDLHCTLYIVGKGTHHIHSRSPVLMGLSDWSTNPELGVLGDTLASSSFASRASILVVQQYAAEKSGSPEGENGAETALNGSSTVALQQQRSKRRDYFDRMDYDFDQNSDEEDDDTRLVS
ncbi:hypothetical protein Tsubulata_033838 [Turnera subulata]|uniref:Cation/H+ exchanger domain-containing protein n=1 Tax=Turnera subulata TaxID=218843 RepID=A0A9Q0JB98_9ROSI|nr:hypothetical protein Tsubulata_033838 [Turnera subulata]